MKNDIIKKIVAIVVIVSMVASSAFTLLYYLFAR